LPRCVTAATTAGPAGADGYHRQPVPQPAVKNSHLSGLLMCPAGSSSSGPSAWWKASPPGLSTTVAPTQPATLSRHIPVQQPPTRPTGLHLPMAPSSKEKLSASVVDNGNLTDSQPLNLSTRTPPPSQQPQHQHHDIPTEA
jgi:hypothetical protein